MRFPSTTSTSLTQLLNLLHSYTKPQKKVYLTRQTMDVQRNTEARSRITATYLGVRVRAGGWGRWRMHVRACSLAYPACNAYAPYCDVFCGPSGYTTFFEVIKDTIFENKGTEHKMCVLIFSATFV
jgi:hypothetical protein